MSTTQEKLVRYLHDAHAMELALVRTLQAHVAMTPSGPYRDTLERHLRETRSHADRIARRLADLGQSQSIVDTGYGLAQRVVSQVLALGKGPLDMIRGASAEEKLLKNARDECASEAFEIATYDALETLATEAGDDLTARLAIDHRADEERMLTAVREELPRLAGAVIGAEVHGRRAYDAGSTGAAQAASGAAPEAVMPSEPERGETQAREPFAGYDELNVDQVVRRLDGLMPEQLRDVDAYERAHKQRRSVIVAVERRRANGDRDGDRAPAATR